MLTTCGNVICGSARAKETLDWLSGDIFGKVKQIKKNMSIDKEGESSITLNEEMAEMVPAAKIADMPTGWLCGQTARDFRPTQKSQMKEMDIENSPVQDHQVLLQDEFRYVQNKKRGGTLP